MFGPVIAGQRRGYLHLAGVAATVAMDGQRLGVAHPDHNVAHNGQPG